MNGWHGSAHSAMHTCSSALPVLQHAADCVHDNCTATIKDALTGMNGVDLLELSMHHAAAHCWYCSTQQMCTTITVQLQSKMYSWNEWLAWLCSCSAMHMCSSTAAVPQHAQIVYMIPVQPQSKMYSWNEWLAWLCSPAMHTQQRTAVVPQRSRLCT
jgi:hypothetical protein